MGPDPCDLNLLDTILRVFLLFILVVSVMIRMALLFTRTIYFRLLGSMQELLLWLRFLSWRLLPTPILQMISILGDHRMAPRISHRVMVRRYFDRGRTFTPAFPAKWCLYSFVMIIGAYSCFYTGASLPFIRHQQPPGTGMITSVILWTILVGCYFIQLLYGVKKIHQACWTRKFGISSFARCTKVFSVIASLSSSRLNTMGAVSFDSASIGSCIIDNCVTGHICNTRSDFIGPICRVQDDTKVATIGDVMLKPEGVGEVQWCWIDDEGTAHTYRLRNVFFFPDSPVNILSLTAFAKQLGDSSGTYVTTYRDNSNFVWDGGKYERFLVYPDSGLPKLPLYQSTPSSRSFFGHLVNSVSYPQIVACSTFVLNEQPNYELPEVNVHFMVGDKVIYTKDGKTFQGFIKGLNDGGTYDVSDESSMVITTTTHDFLRFRDDPDIGILSTSKVSDFKKAAEFLSAEELNFVLNQPKPSIVDAEFMQWHERLNHLSPTYMFRLVDRGVLPAKLNSVRSCPPKCSSCIFGRAHRRNWRTRGPYNTIRGQSSNLPGACTSIDQLISAQPGLVPQVCGKLTSFRITAATVFVDHFSDFTFVYLQQSASQEETIEAKLAYERLLRSYGFRVKAYHADNGRFMDHTFQLAVAEGDQRISFCGVGSHHQNGIVENRIRTLTESSRTLLLHAQRMWPEAITQVLWPFALKMACDNYNNFHLNNDGKSPIERLTGCSHSFQFQDFHTWGCPVYVLDSRLQSGIKGVPKWEPRSRLGIFVGYSPVHARSVALVLNPSSGYISPQFHTIFDDTFSTVPFLRKGEVPTHWTELATSSIVSLDIDSSPSLCTGVTTFNFDHERSDTHSQQTSTNHEGDRHLMPIDLSKIGLRRSHRERTLTSKMVNSSEPGLAKRIYGLSSVVSMFTYLGATATSLGTNLNSISLSTFLSRTISYHERLNRLFDSTINHVHSFTTMVENNESYTFKEMLNQEDKSSFIQAMLNEVEEHENRGHWTPVLRSSMPSGSKTILSIWSFKRKRGPDGRLLKHKARLCAHGGMQRWGLLGDILSCRELDMRTRSTGDSAYS